LVASDWEGPWVIADHAYEVTKRGVPCGARLFAGISEYDDYLAYVRRKEGYEPGDTLSLIAPFLIAYSINNDFLITVARDNANFIEGSLEAIKWINELGYFLKVVSTSYCQYIHYTAALAGIPPANTRCTRFPIDGYSKIVKDDDKKFVKDRATDIINLPRLNITASTNQNELPLSVLETIKKLDTFFWEDLPQTSYDAILTELKPIGGRRKLEAIKEALDEEGKTLHESLTIGDSITDWIMLKETRDAGGLAVSFNGNDYAVENANLAIISKNCMVTPVIVDLFERAGIEKLEEIVLKWNYDALKEASHKGYLNSHLLQSFIESIGFSNMPIVTWIKKDNLQETIAKSKAMRKTVRGIAVGSLG